MATITPNKLITEPNINDQGWGLTLNTDFSILDQSLGSSFPVTLTGSALSGTPYALTPSTPLVGGISWWTAQQLVVTGLLTANATVTIPTTLGSGTAGGAWIIYNGTTNTGGPWTLTFKTASGTGVTIAQGSSAYVYSNGINILYADNNITNSLTSPTFTSLTVNGTSNLNGTSSAVSLVLPNAVETTTVSATAATGTINYYTASQSVLYYTTSASGNWTLNVAHSSGTTLNAALAVNQTITLVFMATQGATAYYPSSFTIDGSPVTPKWQGGSAPVSGNINGVDVYAYTIVKTSSSPTYSVFASQTQFK